jgi:hypothetical protein
LPINGALILAKGFQGALEVRRTGLEIQQKYDLPRLKRGSRDGAADEFADQALEPVPHQLSVNKVIGEDHTRPIGRRSETLEEKVRASATFVSMPAASSRDLLQLV